MEFVLINNAELTEEQLYNIANIKSQHWPHPIDSQIEWMRKNYNCLDTHIILMDGAIAIGYVAIVGLNVVANEKGINSLGISCLCVDQRYHSHGYGSLMMERALKFADDNKRSICLLCKEKLVGFYNKCGYKKVVPDFISVAQVPFEHEFMVYDDVKNDDVKVLKKAHSILIDRNF